MKGEGMKGEGMKREERREKREVVNGWKVMMGLMGCLALPLSGQGTAPLSGLPSGPPSVPRLHQENVLVRAGMDPLTTTFSQTRAAVQGSRGRRSPG